VMVAQIPMDPGAVGTLELDHLAAAQAYQVMMLVRAQHFVTEIPLLEAQLPHKAQLLEQTQGAIDGGEAEAGAFSSGQAMDLVGT